MSAASEELSVLHEAAHRSAVLVPRPGRAFRRVTGRAPADMLSGLLAGAMPPTPTEVGDTWWRGSAPCSAMLTPKGRMICDMRVHRLELEPGGALLLDIPDAGLARALEHFARYLPPRMARVEADLGTEQDEALSSVSIVGPEAPGLLVRALGPLPPPTSPSDLEEDQELVAAGTGRLGLRIVRSRELGAEGYDVLGSPDAVASLADRLTEAGVPEGTPALRELLRIERGRPAFGVEMDADTMPGEAGILDRCVDTSKGCFTGQEVVIRIRDRGHVNRHLRGFLLEHPPSAVPTTVYSEGDERPMGEIRSLATHPVTAQNFGLGFVRRELEPPCAVRVGAPDGRRAHVRSLDHDGWRFEKGDASFYP